MPRINSNSYYVNSNGTPTLLGTSEFTEVIAGTAATATADGLAGTQKLAADNVADTDRTKAMTAAAVKAKTNTVKSEIAASGTASAWTTARTLTLTGKAIGTASIKGDADVSLNVTSVSICGYCGYCSYCTYCSSSNCACTDCNCGGNCSDSGA